MMHQLTFLDLLHSSCRAGITASCYGNVYLHVSVCTLASLGTLVQSNVIQDNSSAFTEITEGHNIRDTFDALLYHNTTHYHLNNKQKV